jgi:hypothetical protein
MGFPLLRRNKPRSDPGVFWPGALSDFPRTHGEDPYPMLPPCGSEGMLILSTDPPLPPGGETVEFPTPVGMSSKPC